MLMTSSNLCQFQYRLSAPFTPKYVLSPPHYELINSLNCLSQWTFKRVIASYFSACAFADFDSIQSL